MCALTHSLETWTKFVHIQCMYTGVKSCPTNNYTLIHGKINYICLEDIFASNYSSWNSCFRVRNNRTQGIFWTKTLFVRVEFFHALTCTIICMLVCKHTTYIYRGLVWHFLYCYQQLIIMWKWLWLVIRNYATVIQIRYI